MMAAPLPSFDPDFAANADWAGMYRACGLQVVPARFPMRTREDKRPALAGWREFQEALVGDGLFATWFTPQATPNMGLITGRASDNTFVVDLDDHASPEAAFWWQACLEVNNSGMDLETWKQVTGGGGRQLFFRAPPGWHAPTNRTPLGVDIRGQGGFAMLPPSVHMSGKEYTWAPGFAPWECELMEAPQWLLDAVDALVEQYGGDKPREGSERPERTASPATDFDAFGARVDGREDAMRSWVWRSVLELYRASGGHLPEDGGRAHYEASLDAWLRHTKTRLTGVDNATGLERECRGAIAFRAKWNKALSKWGGQVARDAAAAPERRESADPFAGSNFQQGSEQAEEFQGESAAAKPARFLFETVADLRALPPASWLVKDWIPAGGSGIFYGKWAAGKSFIGFDLALHLAYGMVDWHGAVLPEGGVPVLVLAREGHTGFVGRVDAFRRHHGLVEDTNQLVFMRASVSFMLEDDFTALCAAVQATGIKFGLILVDTVARVLPGVDMNEQATVTLFTERCAILGAVTGASVVGVHHQNKSGGMMGSSYFEANADFVFEITRLGEEADPLRNGEITCTKMKDGEDRWKRSITYEKVALSDIDASHASLVVGAIESAQERDEKPRAADPWPEKAICRRILDAMRAAWAAGRPWSHYPQAKRDQRYAPERISRQFGVSAGMAEHMVREWLANDVLAVAVTDKRNNTKGLQVVGSID